MKKTLLSILIIPLSMGLFGQAPKKIAQQIDNLQTQNANFKKYSVLNEISEKNVDAELIVKNATYAKLDLSEIGNIYNQKSQTVEISIPYNGNEIDVILYRVNPLSDSFKLNTNLSQNVPYTPGVHYQGIIKGISNSVASFNFFEDKFNGIISSNEFGNLNIGKLKINNNKTDYIVYSDLEMTEIPDWSCATDDFAKDPSIDQPESMQFLGPDVTEKCVTMYYEMDYHLFMFNDSDIDETMDWMASAFNNMHTLYNNDGITISLNEVFIWETQDPYQGSGGSSDYLAKFNQIRPNFPADVGQLIGGNDNSGGGVAATIDGLCNDDNYSYAGVDFYFGNVPNYSWTVMVITHENGHVLGSRHTHACVWNGNNTAIDGCSGFTEGGCSIPGIPAEGGTIMSYCHIQSVGINFNLGFGVQPTTVLVNNINSQTCLSSDCSSVCFNTVQNISITNITQTEAVLEWSDTDEDAIEWQYAVRPVGNNNPLEWVNSDEMTVNLSGLTRNTFYNAYVRKICGDIVTEEFYNLFVTDGNFCEGDLFTDSGGETSGYTNNENYVRTMVPTNQNEKVKVTFTTFMLENNQDFLYIYDGLDTSAPELFEGGLTSSEGISEGPFEATNEDGAITFHFISNGNNVRQGWVGNVECLTLGVDDLSAYLDYSYYPNPVIDILNIISKNEILNASIYNVEGRKVSSNSLKSMSAQLDMSALPTGTYFVELNFKEKPIRFKVIKK